MINSTLCYIEKEDSYLMLHRTKKENDLNEGKWIGVGGKFENDESPEECIIRETFEETGLVLNTLKYRGLLTFISDKWETEYIFVYTSNKFEGNLIDCNEGELKWIKKSDIFKLNLWQGDSIFLKKLINNDIVFSIKLKYEGDNLIEYKELL